MISLHRPSALCNVQIFLNIWTKGPLSQLSFFIACHISFGSLPVSPNWAVLLLFVWAVTQRLKSCCVILFLWVLASTLCKYADANAWPKHCWPENKTKLRNCYVTLINLFWGLKHNKHLISCNCVSYLVCNSENAVAALWNVTPWHFIIIMK